MNGAKSTGPKTEQGKNHARYNAVKHNLTGKNPGIDEAEQQKFTEIFNGLCEEQAPVGISEICSVERIARLQLRDGRFSDAEKGAIQKNFARRMEIDYGEKEGVQSALFQIEVAKKVAAIDPALACLPSAQLYKSVLGLVYLIKFLTDLQLAVEKDVVTKPRIQELVALFPLSPGTASYDFLATPYIIFPLDKGVTLTAAQKEVLCRKLQIHKEHLAERLEQLNEMNKLKREAGRLADVVPKAKTFDKLLRYEKATQRAIELEYEHLRRLQKDRRERAKAEPPEHANLEESPSAPAESVTATATGASATDEKK